MRRLFATPKGRSIAEGVDAGAGPSTAGGGLSEGSGGPSGGGQGPSAAGGAASDAGQPQDVFEALTKRREHADKSEGKSRAGKSRRAPSTAAVLLAAGAGERFEGSHHKLRAEFRGRPLLSWSLEAALRASLDAAYVVFGAEDFSDLLGDFADEVIVVLNPGWAKGQSGSLQAGVRAAELDGHTAVVVGVADQPLTGAEAWRLTAFAPGSIVTASFGGRRRPPVKLDSSVWPLLPLGGDEGARALMRRRPELVRDVDCPGDPTDIDTLEDLLSGS